MSGGNIKVKRRLERAWYLASTISVLVILILTIILVALRLSGFQIFTVTSGSMEPSYPVGSLIYVAPTDTSTLKAGDVVTFMNNENTIVTHRIAEIITESTTNGQVIKFRTKGDANSSVDNKLIHSKNVVGVPVITIPFLGYISYYLQHPPGLYIALIVGTFLISMIIIPSLLKHRRKEQPIKTEA